ncbi:unnamed protein product [Trichogramma brassicae]|uniref:CCHC-type domain-containing protein n=1 Tax=Trichogramma brassicae TaxID=86971 RepID=A0A6H5IP62_9HYME|nr:unnamed protein product [Trichogramma brassicae]
MRKQKHGYCFNCLGRGHKISDCPSSRRCLTCKKKHHTKLHVDSGTSLTDAYTSSGAAPASTDSTGQLTVFMTTTGCTVLRGTAEVHVTGKNCTLHRARALIDPAAEASFTVESLADSLMLDREKAIVDVFGVADQFSGTARARASCMVKPTFDRSAGIPVSAWILPTLSNILPKQTVLRKTYPHLSTIKLADPHYYRSRSIDLLLGADLYPLLIRAGLITGSSGTPVTQKTIFGWILTGPISNSPSSVHVAERQRIDVFQVSLEPALSEALTRFWQLEEIPSKSTLTKNELHCEEYYFTTVQRNEHGRFIVRLPLRSTEPIADSREIATACFLSVERRLSRHPELRLAYTRFMQEYIDLGHMHLASPQEIASAKNYLPHHAVFKPDTKKIRVVFNASRRNHLGRSLNKSLFTGPKLQADLTGVLCRWRFFQFVFTADVVKMYRQILIHADDQCWQHILWREDPNKPIRDYRASTVTYGTAAAPFLALRTML